MSKRGSGIARSLSEGRVLGSVAVLLTDVEPAVHLNAELESRGVEVELISPLDDVRGVLHRLRPAVVVLTGALSDGVNLSLVQELLWEEVSVIGLTDVLDGHIEARLRSAGYTELYLKPVLVTDLASAIQRRLERHSLVALTGLAGESEAMREVMVKVEQIAPVSSTVLIEGESGTGKELVARAIHRLGNRRAKPFIAVNAGALPETLLESELFGHEKGSFTGAAERRLGRFELADTGTLFLDEIGEVSASTQVRLLRVLEERIITRVGGNQSIPVDVRIVAATNRPLRDHVEDGSFRADLYYRLNVLSIYLPPLRERREDIPLLVRRFVREFSEAHERTFSGISAEAMELLVSYAWPGNVRELRNLIESMVVLAPGREIGSEDIPRSIRESGSRRFLPVPVGPLVREGERAQGRELEFIVRSLVELKLQVEELRRRLDEDGRSPVSTSWLGEAPVVSGLGVGVGEVWYGGGIPARDAISQQQSLIEVGPNTTMAEIERRAIEAMLRQTDGNRRKAAELLGIGERTLYRKLREFHVDGSLPDLDAT